MNQFLLLNINPENSWKRNTQFNKLFKIKQLLIMKQKLLFNQFGYRVLTTWYFFIHLMTILQIVKKVIKKISMNFLAKYFLFYFYFCWWCKKKLYTFPSIIITCFWIFLSIYFLWCQLLHSYCSSLSLIKYLKQKIINLRF